MFYLNTPLFKSFFFLGIIVYVNLCLKVTRRWCAPETVLQTPNLEPKQVLDLETSQAQEPTQAMEIFRTTLSEEELCWR